MSSRIKARIACSKLSSAMKPNCRARWVSNSPGQPATMRLMAASGSNRTRAATTSPATARSASSISRTRTLMPGRLSVRNAPNAEAGSVAAWMKLLTTAAGLESHSASSAFTGHTACSPCSGSRMMPLANDEAALFGLPGRTLMVGRRSTRPSTKPLRA